MLSDALRDRFITVLGFWDADRDGAIEESDYEVAAGRIAGLSGLKPGSMEYEQLHSQLVNGGWQLMRQFDSNGDGRVTVEEALVGLRRATRRSAALSRGHRRAGLQLV